MQDLLTFKQAAEIANIPAATLEVAAFGHGLLVQMGTYKRIERDSLKELYKACRVKPSPPASTKEKHVGVVKQFSSSKTVATKSQRAQDAAAKLKRISAST